MSRESEALSASGWCMAQHFPVSVNRSTFTISILFVFFSPRSLPHAVSAGFQALVLICRSLNHYLYLNFLRQGFHSSFLLLIGHFKDAAICEALEFIDYPLTQCNYLSSRIRNSDMQLFEPTPATFLRI